MTPIDTKTRDKIVRLLMLSTSMHDGEALGAIRKANAMLAERGLNWEGIFSQSPQPAPQVRTARPRWTSAAAQSPGAAWQKSYDDLMNHLWEEAVRSYEANRAHEQRGDRGMLDELMQRPLPPHIWEFCQGLSDHLKRHGSLSRKQAEALRRTYSRHA